MLLRVGGGVSWHLIGGSSGSGSLDGVEVDFDNAWGGVMEAAFVYTAVAAGVRYTPMTYRVTESGGEARRELARVVPEPAPRAPHALTGSGRAPGYTGSFVRVVSALASGLSRGAPGADPAKSALTVASNASCVKGLGRNAASPLGPCSGRTWSPL